MVSSTKCGNLVMTLCLICVVEIGEASFVLSIPSYVSQSKQYFWANCSSKIIPQSISAEFTVNDKTHTTVYNRPKGRMRCYSSRIKRYCTTNECQCSSDGREYSIRLKQLHGVAEMSVGCSMKFENEKPRYIQQEVKLLDIGKLKIASSETLPLTFGQRSRITCKVQTTLNVQLNLRCMDKVSSENHQTLMQSVHLDIDADSTQTNESSCICCLKFEGYTERAVLLLPLTVGPKLNVSENLNCNVSDPVRLECYIPGNFHVYTFLDWEVHLLGKFITSYRGQIEGKTSVIEINRCSYKNAGQYTCAAYLNHNNETYYINKTTDLKIIGIPTVVKTDTIEHHSYTEFYIKYFSESETTVKWYHGSTELANTSSLSLITAETKLLVDVYSTPYNVSGYVSALTVNIRQNTNGGVFRVVLRNIYGELQYNFVFEPVMYFPVLRIWLFLTGIGIFIFMTGILGIVVQVKIRQTIHMKASERNRDRIYFAAPEDERYRRVYNTTRANDNNLEREAEHNANYIDPVADDSSSHYEEILDGTEFIDETAIIESQPHYMEIIS